MSRRCERSGSIPGVPIHVAFLRAINLGSVRRFPKADVEAVTLAAGFTGVTSHLATGNVRLETPMRSRARVQAALERAYAADRGFEVPTMVVSPAELRQVVADAEEIGAGHAGTRYVSFLKVEPDPAAVEALEARSGRGERVVVRGRAAHLLVGEQAHTARLSNAVVERHLGVATNRNVRVVATLVERWC